MRFEILEMSSTQLRISDDGVFFDQSGLDKGRDNRGSDQAG